jgi:hypothetical protein
MEVIKMQKGIQLQQLAQEITRVAKTKQDYIVGTNTLRYGADGHVTFDAPNETGERTVGIFDVTRHCDSQIADKTGIPWKYYERMKKDSPELLAENVNTWFDKEPKKRLVRTLDGRIRAFLSDRFRPIDNFDVGNVALKVIAEAGAEVVSAKLTETRMYIQAVVMDRKELSAEIKVGDVVKAGITVSNSEVGVGKWRVEPLIYRLSCLNGMISSHSLGGIHVGKKIDSESDKAYEVFRTETIEADNKALMMKIEDVTRSSIQPEVFEAEVIRIQEAEKEPITGKLPSVVKEVTNQFGFTQNESDNILTHLAESGSLTKWGLINAVTAQAHETEDYDRSVEFERAGGKILDLTGINWKRVAEAEAKVEEGG